MNGFDMEEFLKWADMYSKSQPAAAVPPAMPPAAPQMNLPAIRPPSLPQTLPAAASRMPRIGMSSMLGAAPWLLMPTPTVSEKEEMDFIEQFLKEKRAESLQKVRQTELTPVEKVTREKIHFKPTPSTKSESEKKSLRGKSLEDIRVFGRELQREQMKRQMLQEDKMERRHQQTLEGLRKLLMETEGDEFLSPDVQYER